MTGAAGRDGWCELSARAAAAQVGLGSQQRWGGGFLLAAGSSIGVLCFGTTLATLFAPAPRVPGGLWGG